MMMNTMRTYLYLVTCTFFIMCNGPQFGSTKEIKKRQIYREQVLPHRGGKIPETAFHTDRLALNQLQKQGIAVPDGVLLQQRDPQVYQFSHKSMRPVLKVETTSDQRYTPTEGQYLHLEQPSIDTTYPVPQISNHNLYAHHHHPQIVHLPLHRPLVLPNPLLKQNPFPLQSHHYQSFNGKVIIGPPPPPPPQHHSVHHNHQHHHHPSIDFSGLPSPATAHNNQFTRYSQQHFGSPFFKWDLFHNDVIFNDFDTLFGAVSNHL